ncbi:Fructosamine/Ketosamine-3-kinase [Lineolata rhizophorae]|uniref:protein-ribulosamine 3-kinase n=1 Tax=Lineolata rhizophorae TaxID=578093 RepID=A0A6A6NLU7_9PEZI|nr:Fructosamine/Ketosamine-3-kinase [Lineolata rhizophorae]
MKVDEAVLKLLSLDPAKTTVSSHGGGGMSSASTSRISTELADGRTKNYFMKTGRGEDARVMFEGEHASLSAIHAAVPSLCPNSLGWGQFASNPATSFLVTDFLDLSGRASLLGGPSSSSSSAKHPRPPSLARKLAQLHSCPAPVPPGRDRPAYGFPVTTCCGDTPQDNGYADGWAEFYAERRLRFILGRSEASNGPDAELGRLVEATAGKVVPRLLGEGHLGGAEGIRPVVVHGDLWSGNASRGRVDGVAAFDEYGGVPQDVVFDPSACYAHSEYELGIMRMFGGFGAAFWREYHELVPKTEPVGEYEDRVRLYELYHHLNHHALFGGGYRSGAVSIMKDLVRKYGKG